MDRPGGCRVRPQRVKLAHRRTDAQVTCRYVGGSRDRRYPHCPLRGDVGQRPRRALTPDEAGTWTWKASFRTGNEVSVRGPDNGTPTGFDGAEGSFDVAPTDKSGRDFRTKGMVRYVGGHHLRHAGTGEYYLKGGADSPENLLGYEDFDGTRDLGGLSTPGLPNGLHTFAPQVDNWRSGDPTRDGDLGKGLVGALNHLGSGG